MSGKGSKRRPTNEQEYGNNYDAIFRKEVPSPISKDVVARFPCAYPEGRPLNEFYTANNAQHKCLKQYETLIDGLIKKYGVK